MVTVLVSKMVRIIRRKAVRVLTEVKILKHDGSIVIGIENVEPTLRRIKQIDYYEDEEKLLDIASN